MRLLLVVMLAACSSPEDDVVVRVFDATAEAHPPIKYPDASMPEVEAGAVYLGGPLACGTCTCDGTLYTCIESFRGCAGYPPTADASCGSDDFMFCSEIPIACLPKPTCECISKALNLACTIAPDGSGFLLSCL